MIFTFGADFCKQPPVSNDLIRGILDLDSLSYCFGDSEAGKSFLMLDRDLHIAHGKNWCGRKTKQGIVLYLAGEGKHGLMKRVKAWHEFYNLPLSNNIAFSTVPTALCEPQAVSELITEIQSLIKSINRKPVLIELDTLNRHFGNGDENSTRDMTAFVSGMDKLRLETGAAISTVHHCGHGAKDRSRGSIVLFNSVDFAYCVSKSGETLADYETTMKFHKVKDYEKPSPFAWRWQRQVLPWADEDDDGNIMPMSSVVLVPTEYRQHGKTEALGKRQQKALEILEQLHRQHQDNLTSGDCNPCSAMVRFDDWMDALKEIDKDKTNRNTLSETLEKRKLISISNGYVKLL